MRRDYGQENRNSVFYSTELLTWCLRKAGFNSPYALAKHLGINADTTYRVFNGNGSYKQVKPIADFLGIKWSELHKPDLPTNRFHRAVLSGDSLSVR